VVNSTPRIVRPFPWATFDSMTRAEAALLRDVGRWSRAHTSLESIESAAAELIDARVDVLLRRVTTFRVAAPFNDGIGVLLTAAEGNGVHGCVLIEAERALATQVVARALRRSPPRVVDATAPGSPALAGAFSAVLVALARRVHSNAALRVLRVGSCVELEADLARKDIDLAAVTLTVIVREDAFAARALIPHRACVGAPAPPFSSKVLERLGPTPLAMSVVACTARARVAEIGALRAGDAFVPDRWSQTRSDDGNLRGRAWLAAPDGELGIRVELAGDGRVVLAGDVDALSGTEDGMVDSNEENALVSAVGDVPVVVRVEIGEARMSAREWASLARGDVIALGRRLGDPVVLRVGGVAMARGELVDIDGEVGVRIVQSLQSGPQPYGERTDQP